MNAAGPLATAISHQVRMTVPPARPQPVTRWVIDVAMVTGQW
ncbi:MAG: hypothetical protein WDN03_14985 [Rhizomicrobium sp.]